MVEARTARVQGPRRGLELIRPLQESGALADYFLLHSAVGDLERRLGHQREARAAHRRALGLATGRRYERFLRRRLEEPEEPEELEELEG